MGAELTPDLVERIKDTYSSCSVLERQYLRKMLEEIADHGYSETYNDVWLMDYKEIPVSINTFLDSDLYLGKATRQGQAIYPYWRKTMNAVFNSGNKYNEVVFTGATRIGKTSTGITATAYMLYRLMCMRDPQKFFGKKDVSKFSVMFFNLTKDLAKGVAFREFNDTLRVSPWFNAHGKFSKSDKDFYYIPEGDKVDIDYGSDASHGLGKQVFVGFLDEINFAKANVKDIGKAKQHVRDLYNTISARIKGTFRQDGEVYGKLFAISSKRTDSDFMEDYIHEQQAAGAGDHMYVVDEPQWKILPERMFSKQRFYIAVGGRNQRGFVVPNNQATPEGLADITKQGFTLLDPPVDMRPEFLADFDIALRDLAGIAVPGALSFITQASLNACITKTRKNPFYSDVLSIGTKDTLTIEEFFHMNEIDARTKHLPHYIHLDLSLNTDRTGMSMVCENGKKDITSEDGKVVSQPMIHHDFSVALEAPRGDKIPYAKITAFICWLRKQGFNIQVISRDQFQSEYMAQLLEAQGFTVNKLSLDRTPDGYVGLRSMILEERIDMLDCQLLQDELIHLQRDALSGKIDHTISGSKDLSDSFAGAIWSCTLDSPGIVVPAKSIANAIASVNGARNRVSRQSPTRGFAIPFSGTGYKKY